MGQSQRGTSQGCGRSWQGQERSEIQEETWPECGCELNGGRGDTNDSGLKLVGSHMGFYMPFAVIVNFFATLEGDTKFLLFFCILVEGEDTGTAYLQRGYY